jgi:CheY-like chemotaxis protein
LGQIKVYVMAACADVDNHAKTTSSDKSPAATARGADTSAHPATQSCFITSDPDGAQAATVRVGGKGQATERQSPSGVITPTAEAKLRVLASMVAEVRTELHAILGGTQLLQLNGSLDLAQSEQVETILGAGMKLLRKINQAVNLADEDADPNHQLAPAASPSASHGRAGNDTHGEVLHAAVPDRALRILVVDDIATNREIASTFVRAAGHMVETAIGGAEAVTAAATGDFDVILMDVRMPNVDGLQASRLIRALPGVRGRVPIVALTAQTSVDQVETCREIGMNGYLAKPFRYDTLIEALHRSYSEMPTRRAVDVDPAVSVDDSGCGPREVGRARGSPLPHAGGRDEDGFTRAYCDYIQSDAASRDAIFKSAAHRAADEMGEEAGPRSTWIEIASPWNDGLQEQRQERSYIVDTQFNVTLTAVGPVGNRVLADKRLTCEPLRDQDQYEFHWLLYVDPLSGKSGTFRTTCDLWRWSGSVWRSITAGGAKFTPDELYGFGWRYCGPCVEKSACVKVV